MIVKKVLVVDDSEVNLYLLQAMFADDFKVQVNIESDSTKALSLLREGSFDVLVLDLMMPQKDGYQLLEEIKADPKLCKIPIIVISASIELEAYERAMAYGVQGYFKKPIQMDEVVKKIRQQFVD